MEFCSLFAPAQGRSSATFSGENTAQTFKKKASSRRSRLSKTVLALFGLLTVDQLSLISPVRADQPIHCLRGQVYGTWQFFTTQKADKVNLFQIDEVCTHKLPNKLQIISNDHEWNFDNSDSWKVKLMDKYQAEATFCPKGGSCESAKTSGNWSPIYDQAVKIELQNGLRFLANFKYTVKAEISQDPTKDGSDEFQSLKAGDYNKFDTHCDRTMVGFVQTIPSIKSNEVYTMKEHNVQCFYGVQQVHYDMEKTVQVKTDSDQVKVAVITNQNKVVTDAPADAENLQVDSEIQTEVLSSVEEKQRAKIRSFGRSNMAQSQRFNAHLSHVPSDETDAAISFINNNDFGWKADVCKLQTHHEDYGSHCKSESMLLAQTESSSSESLEKTKKKAKKKFGENTQEFKKALEKAQSYGKKYKTADEIPDSEIPESYDFTDIDGYDFTNPVRDQGACGSCYTVSFTQVIESRLKLKYGKETPILSSQYLMQCNYMNEGCDGGWSFFHGYLAENGHLVTEECAPYKAKTKGSTCGDHKGCPTAAKISKSYFIGGAYGESSEKKMMKEILHKGIVNGELNVPRVFSFYQQGILSNDHESKMSSYLEYSGVAANHKEAQQLVGVGEKTKKMTDRDLEDYGVAWMNLNHSVVILGWGVDKKGTKYWKVRNSYGTRWGMNGDFWVRRGENDFGIESETTAYGVIKCKPNTDTYKCVEDI